MTEAIEDDKIVSTYVARRRLKMAPNVWREPGQLVPECVLWVRWESHLHVGNIRETKVPAAEFEEALGLANPPLTELDIVRIREHHGQGDFDNGVSGLHKTPFTRTQVLKQAAELREAPQMNQPVVLTGPVPSDINPKPRPARKVTVQRAATPLKRTARKRPVKVKPTA